MNYLNYLLLPRDEVELDHVLVHDLALDPVGATPREDRSLPRQDSTEPYEFIYWASEIWPIRRLGDAPPPADAVESVLLSMNQEANPSDWEDLIDAARSPLIRLQRTNWNRNGCLNPGLLQAMAAPKRANPPELLALHRRAVRWLQSSGERLNPFEHCSEPAVPQPNNLNAFWVWARPHALEWVRAGGEVWPWNA